MMVICARCNKMITEYVVQLSFFEEKLVCNYCGHYLGESLLFFVFEGGEGVGKSTIIKYVEEFFELKGYEVVVTREPGGYPLAEKVRNLILEDDLMDSKTEALLFAAARREHIVNVIIPALSEGKVVLCDRYVFSSYVYQGLVPHGTYQAIKDLNDYATSGFMPTKTFLLDVSPEITKKRMSFRKHQSRFDKKDEAYHHKVREAYLLLASSMANPMEVIDANQTVTDVTREVLSKLKEWGETK